MAITRAKDSSIITGDKYISFLAGNPTFTLNSFELIATVNGDGTSSTLTFSSIPQDYVALQIRYIAKNTNTNVTSYTQSLQLQVNGVTSNSYIRHRLYGNGTSAVADSLSTTAIDSSNGVITSSSSWANMMSPGIIDIHDYASTTRLKTVRWFYGTTANSTNTNFETGLLSGMYYAATTAITSVSLVSPALAFTTSSQFRLYGIRG